jgi:Na+/H+ antiporter NhaC
MGIGTLVSFTNITIANDTVSVIITGAMEKQIKD